MRDVDRPHAPFSIATAFLRAVPASLHFDLHRFRLRSQGVRVEVYGDRHEPVLLKYVHHVGNGESGADNAASPWEVEGLKVEVERRPDGEERGYGGGESGCGGRVGVAIGVFFAE